MYTLTLNGHKITNINNVLHIFFTLFLKKIMENFTYNSLTFAYFKIRYLNFKTSQFRVSIF
jgi:hypothetical protein